MSEKEATTTYIGAGIIKITFGNNYQYTTVSAMTPSESTCPETPVLTIGNSLRELRQGKLLSQSAIAKVLGISAQQWNKYELDKNPISLKNIVILCDAFNIDIAEFIEHFTDIKNQNNTNAIETKMMDLITEKNKYIKELELKLEGLKK